MDVSSQFFKAVKYHFTESQNVRGWKGPLWVIWSNPPAEEGSPTAGCTGPCPGRNFLPFLFLLAVPSIPLSLLLTLLLLVYKNCLEMGFQVCKTL